jgi:uncharacterized membrane protein
VAEQQIARMTRESQNPLPYAEPESKALVARQPGNTNNDIQSVTIHSMDLLETIADSVQDIDLAVLDSKSALEFEKKRAAVEAEILYKILVPKLVKAQAEENKKTQKTQSKEAPKDKPKDDVKSTLSLVPKSIGMIGKMSVAMGAISTVLGGIGSVVKGIAGGVAGLAKGLLGGLLKGVGAVITAPFKMLGGLLQKGGEQAGLIVLAITWGLGFIKGFIEKKFPNLNNFLNDIGKFIGDAFNTTKQFFEEHGPSIAKFLTETLPQWLTFAATELFPWMVNSIVEGFYSIQHPFLAAKGVTSEGYKQIVDENGKVDDKKLAEYEKERNREASWKLYTKHPDFFTVMLNFRPYKMNPEEMSEQAQMDFIKQNRENFDKIFDIEYQKMLDDEKLFPTMHRVVTAPVLGIGRGVLGAANSLGVISDKDMLKYLPETGGMTPQEKENYMNPFYALIPFMGSAVYESAYRMGQERFHLGGQTKAGGTKYASNIDEAGTINANAMPMFSDFQAAQAGGSGNNVVSNSTYFMGVEIKSAGTEGSNGGRQ